MAGDESSSSSKSSDNKSFKIRGGHRAHLTTLLNRAQSELGVEEPSISELQNLKEEILNQHRQIKKLDDHILKQIPEETIANDIQSASEYNMRVTSGVRMIDEHISSHSTDSTANTDSNHSTTRSVKLPNITLNKFDGNPLEWLDFWDLFNSSIHTRTDIAAPAKFHYLSAQLTGCAKELIAGFDHSSDSYNEAISLLRETYGKKKILIRSRLHALMDLPTPDPTSSDLSKFRSSYEGHLRGLKSLGCNIAESGYVSLESGSATLQAEDTR